MRWLNEWKQPESETLSWILNAYVDMYALFLHIFDYFQSVITLTCLICSSWPIPMICIYSHHAQMDLIYHLCVFPRTGFSFKLARVISLSGLHLLGFIHLWHVKIAVLDNTFWGFDIIYYITDHECLKWIIRILIPGRLNFRSGDL